MPVGEARAAALALLVVSACAGRGSGAVDARTSGPWYYHLVALPEPGQLVERVDRGPRSCGIGRDGSLVCWRVGDTSALALAHDARTVAFAFTGDVGCLIDERREISCWDGPWVHAMETGRHPATLDRIGGRAHAPVALAVAESHGCAALADGRVACWGTAMNCLDSRVGPLTPAVVPGVRNAEHLVAAQGFSCAVQVDGQVLCWGLARIDEVAACAAPRPVPGVTRAVELSADGSMVCAMDEGGAIRCWGDEDPEQSWSPRLIALPGPARSLEVIEEVGAHATLADGRVVRWLPRYLGGGEAVQIMTE